MRVRLIEMHERVLIGEQIYFSHKYEFAVMASQFRFITINLVENVREICQNLRKHSRIYYVA